MKKTFWGGLNNKVCSLNTAEEFSIFKSCFQFLKRFDDDSLDGRYGCGISMKPMTKSWLDNGNMNIIMGHTIIDLGST